MNKVYNITIDEMEALNEADYILADLRDNHTFQYGSIPNAVNIPFDTLEETSISLPFDKKIIFYCSRGIYSNMAVSKLRDKGLAAYSLSGGYSEWLRDKLSGDTSQENQKKTCEDVEKSIQKKFHKSLFTKFAKAINTYDLIQPGDKIAVCISGGKDSMLMAKLFQELKRHNKFPFELVFLVMDPGYNETNRMVIEDNAQKLRIPITIFETNIFDSVVNIEKSPCYLCARMRRGYLYSKAQELGCNKIALGHHYDDVIETILMGMLYGGQIQTMMPKLHSQNFKGMELIRPMYLIREEDIRHWRDYNDLYFIQCACRFTDTCSTCSADGSSNSRRMEIKNLILKLKETNPTVESNIFRSVENVNLNTVIEYKRDGVRHHFLEHYDRNEEKIEEG